MYIIGDVASRVNKKCELFIKKAQRNFGGRDAKPRSGCLKSSKKRKKLAFSIDNPAKV
jgi:hypothetical protein